MKIALAQIRTAKGNVTQNIEIHLNYLNRAIAQDADLILFPELSITGYEPDLAIALACWPNDNQFDQFQKISNSKDIIIGIGAPIKNENGICIGILIFQPNEPRQIYTKKYLHEDEMPYFTAGQNESTFIKNTTISLAICYEVFIPTHAVTAKKDGATIYLASVAKSENGIKRAYKRLSEVAKQNKMVVLMCNNVGHCDNFEAKGQSAAWNEKGQLISQLQEKEGLLIIDTLENIDK